MDTLSIWNGKVRLNLEEVRIDKGSYELVLSNLGRGTIAIRIDEYNELNNTQEYSFNYKEFFVCVIIFIHLAALGLFFVVGRIRDGKYSFLVLAVITGLLLVFIIPPYTAPDEMRHFARSYDIASGNIVCASYETKEEYGNQTMPICEFPIELFELKLVSENNGINYTRETNTTIHFDMFLDKMGQRFSGEYVRIPIHGDHTTSSLAFLPQVIMIFLLKLLKVPPCIMFYGARLGNLAAAISLAYAGYNILPQGYRKIYAVLYFAPGICFLRSTSSTDGILYSIVLLFIAIAISLKAEHKSVWKGKVICTLLILACCIGLIKLPYLLIMGLLLLLDRKQFALKGKETFILKLIYVTGMLMAGCILYYISHSILDNNADVASSLYASSTEISGSYIIYVLHHPFRVLNMFFQTFFADFYSYYSSAIALPKSDCLIIPYLSLCAFVVFKIGADQIFNCRERILLIGLGAAMWMIVIVAFYFVGAAPDLGYVWGLQGRYMYPAFPVVLFGAASPKKKYDIAKESFEIISCGSIIMVHVLEIFGLYWI